MITKNLYFYSWVKIYNSRIAGLGKNFSSDNIQVYGLGHTASSFTTATIADDPVGGLAMLVSLTTYTYLSLLSEDGDSASCFSLLVGGHLSSLSSTPLLFPSSPADSPDESLLSFSFLFPGSCFFSK